MRWNYEIYLEIYSMQLIDYESTITCNYNYSHNHTDLWHIIYHCLKKLLLDHMPSFPNHSESTEWKHHNISTTRPSGHQ